MAEKRVCEGGCHCGAVRFRVSFERYEGVECNCSICSKKGILHLIVPREDFELLQGEADLVTYRFNTGVAQHRFCRLCGIHSFYTPRSHPECVDVNIRCLDGITPERFSFEKFDGRHWEDSIVGLRAREAARHDEGSSLDLDEEPRDGTTVGNQPRRNRE